MKSLVCLAALLAATAPVRALDIHFVDTEGGAATLIVTPAGEPILIDCGNPVAKEHKPQPVDRSDNAKSLGFLLSYGDFRFLDLGDLTWNIEYKLIHPSDKIGTVDVYQVTHHGLDISNNTVLIQTVKPTVAVYNNGARKGCAPAVTATLRRVKELKAIYQLHRNLSVGAAENTDPEFIANPD